MVHHPVGNQKSFNGTIFSSLDIWCRDAPYVLTQLRSYDARCNAAGTSWFDTTDFFFALYGKKTILKVRFGGFINLEVTTYEQSH